MKKFIALILLVFVHLSVHAQAILPNHKLTPGVSRGATVEELCTSSTKLVRHTSAKTKLDVYKAYGIQPRTAPECSGPGHSCYEIDHLISLEDGGADVAANLWPQPYDGLWNAHMKDKLENYVHKQICERKMSIFDAQQLLTNDWTKSYKQVFGE